MLWAILDLRKCPFQIGKKDPWDKLLISTLLLFYACYTNQMKYPNLALARKIKRFFRANFRHALICAFSSSVLEIAQTDIQTYPDMQILSCDLCQIKNLLSRTAAKLPNYHLDPHQSHWCEAIMHMSNIFQRFWTFWPFWHLTQFSVIFR